MGNRIRCYPCKNTSPSTCSSASTGRKQPTNWGAREHHARGARGEEIKQSRAAGCLKRRTRQEVELPRREERFERKRRELLGPHQDGSFPVARSRGGGWRAVSRSRARGDGALGWWVVGRVGYGFGYFGKGRFWKAMGREMGPLKRRGSGTGDWCGRVGKEAEGDGGGGSGSLPRWRRWSAERGREGHVARMRWAWAADGPTGTGVGAPAPVPLGSCCLLTHAAVFTAVQKVEQGAARLFFRELQFLKCVALFTSEKNLENSIVALSFVVFDKCCPIID